MTVNFNTVNLVKEKKDFDLSRFKDECFPRLSHILQHLLPQGRVRGSEFVCGDLDGSFGDSCSFSLNRENPGGKPSLQASGLPALQPQQVPSTSL